MAHPLTKEHLSCNLSLPRGQSRFFLPGAIICGYINFQQNRFRCGNQGRVKNSHYGPSWMPVVFLTPRALTIWFFFCAFIHECNHTIDLHYYLLVIYLTFEHIYYYYSLLVMLTAVKFDVNQLKLFWYFMILFFSFYGQNICVFYIFVVMKMINLYYFQRYCSFLIKVFSKCHFAIKLTIWDAKDDYLVSLAHK